MSIKHSLLTTILFSSALLLVVSPISAQTPESSDEATIQQNLKERMKKAAEEQRQQVKGITTGVKKGFIGTVKRISESSMTLETTRGTLIVTLEDVALVKNNAKVETSNVEIENSVVVLGFQNGEDFQPRRIMVSETPLKPTPKTVVIGNVKKIDRTSITVQPRGTSEEKIYSFVSNKTKYQDKDGQTIQVSAIQTDQDVLLITQPENATTQRVKDSSGQALTIRSLADTQKEP